MPRRPTISGPTTTIKISISLRDRIKTYGKMGDNFEVVLVKILDFYDDHKDIHN